MEEKPEIFKSDKNTKVSAIWKIKFGHSIVDSINYEEIVYNNFHRKFYFRKEGTRRYLTPDDIWVMWLHNRFRIKRGDRLEILVEGADSAAEKMALRLYSGVTTKGEYADFERFEKNCPWAHS